MSSELSERLSAVKARLARAVEDAGRPEGSVALVCVSKFHPASAIREAYALGERRFGESYAQELAEKAEELRDLPDIEWHFIGHLQSNKAKLVAKHAHVVHSVDSVSLAKELDKRRRALYEEKSMVPLRVLLEVNVGGEVQKHGVDPAALPEAVAGLRAFDALRLQGLMTMPPLDDLPAAKRVFSTLVTLRNVVAPDLAELSMGMSADLEIAVAAGATMVRIGTAIFGERT